MTEGLEFDPGFAPHILAFQGTVEYLYSDINRFSVFSQRKIKFKQYHKKILDIFYNNLGFYVGCLMWAAYIKEQKEQPILNNGCLGQEYNDTENTGETDFMIKFTELFPKDMKYFAGESFEFPEYVNKILNLYREFLIINKGFVESEKNTDIKLPKGVSPKETESFKDKIETIIKDGNLSKLLEYKDLII